MSVFIALLRGINVGGKNIVPMAELRAALTSAGLQSVKTYIQSGNVVFASRTSSPAKLQATIQGTLDKHFDVKPSVMILTSVELEAAISVNPYADRDIQANCVHLYFLDARPAGDAVEAACTLAASSEEFQIVGNVFYLFAPDGVARSKLASRAERTLGVGATARNLRSSRKILELAMSISE